MRSALLERGAESEGGTPSEFAAFIRSEAVKFKKVIEATENTIQQQTLELARSNTGPIGAHRTP